jgi:hypothetical protein
MAQYLCKHSFVVIVDVSMSRQIGQVNSLCKLLADTAISVSSVIASLKIFLIENCQSVVNIFF